MADSNPPPPPLQITIDTAVPVDVPQGSKSRDPFHDALDKALDEHKKTASNFPYPDPGYTVILKSEWPKKGP